MVLDLLRLILPLALTTLAMAWAWRSSAPLPPGPGVAPFPRFWPVALVPAALVIGSRWQAGTTSSDALTELRGRTDWISWWTGDAGMPSRLHRLIRTVIGGADALGPTAILHLVLAVITTGLVLRAARSAVPTGPWQLVAITLLVTSELLSPFAGLRARALAVCLLMLATSGFQDAFAGRVRGGVRAFTIGGSLAMLDDPTALGVVAPASLLLAMWVPGAARAAVGATALAVAAMVWPAVDAVRFHADAGPAHVDIAALPLTDALVYPALLIPLVLVGQARGTSTTVVRANALVAGVALVGAAGGLAAGLLPSEPKAFSALVPWATLAVALALTEAAPGRVGRTLVMVLATLHGLKTMEEAILRPTADAANIRNLVASLPPEVSAPDQVLVGPQHEVAPFLGALRRLTATPNEADLASPPFAVFDARDLTLCSPGVWGVAWHGEQEPRTPPGLTEGPCACTEHSRAGYWTLYRCVDPAAP